MLDNRLLLCYRKFDYEGSFSSDSDSDGSSPESPSETKRRTTTSDDQTSTASVRDDSCTAVAGDGRKRRKSELTANPNATHGTANRNFDKEYLACERKTIKQDDSKASKGDGDSDFKKEKAEIWSPTKQGNAGINRNLSKTTNVTIENKTAIEVICPASEKPKSFCPMKEETIEKADKGCCDGEKLEVTINKNEKKESPIASVDPYFCPISPDFRVMFQLPENSPISPYPKLHLHSNLPANPSQQLLRINPYSWGLPNTNTRKESFFHFQ